MVEWDDYSFSGPHTGRWVYLISTKNTEGTGARNLDTLHEHIGKAFKIGSHSIAGEYPGVNDDFDVYSIKVGVTLYNMHEDDVLLIKFEDEGIVGATKRR